jgi:hypothetical protein
MIQQKDDMYDKMASLEKQVKLYDGLNMIINVSNYFIYASPLYNDFYSSNDYFTIYLIFTVMKILRYSWKHKLFV